MTFRARLVLLLAVLLPAALPAQTGRCRDGTFTNAATHRGACSRHGGVAEWLPAGAGTTAPVQQGGQAPGGMTAGTSARVAPSSAASASSRSAVKVWVNTPTHVYHCPGTRWYGNTKRGEYMTESQAQASGARPAYGRSCG